MQANEENEMKLIFKKNKIKDVKGCTVIFAITAYYIIFNEDESEIWTILEMLEKF